MPPKHSTGELSLETHNLQDSRYRQGYKYDYIIIGSGMASLTVSALLAQAGYKVCILEAHDVPGGYAHSFKQGSPAGVFKFCAQVHYIWGCGPGGNIHEFLRKTGLDEEITFELLGPYYYDKMVMPDGKHVGIPYGYDRLAENIDAAYPGQGDNVRKFTGILKKIRAEVQMLPDTIRWWEYLTKGWKFLTLLRYKTKTLQNVFDECHLSKEAQAVLIAQAGDFMAPPNELSIFAYTGLFGGYNTGAYYPTKHFNHFIQTITDFITSKDDCHIYYETPVSKIVVDHGKVTGVLTEDGKVFTADKYICNVDPQFVSHKLIGRENFPDNYLAPLNYEYSHTGLMLYLGIRGDLSSQDFGSHNIWHLEGWDMNEMWKKMLAGDYSEPWIYMGTPNLHSSAPGIAPPGYSILEVGTLGGYDYFKKLRGLGDKGKAYQEEKTRIRDILLRIIREKYIPDLNERLVLKVAGSPTTNEHFVRAPRGNAYGQHLTPENMGAGRLKAHTPFSNLFWCNASSGYGGIDGTTGTGVKLYMDLTGDIFYRPENKPSDDKLVALVNQKIGGSANER